MNKVSKSRNYIDILIIILMAFLAMIPLILKGTLFSGADIGYHLNRIFDTYQTLEHHHLFSYVATYSLNRIGIASNMSYGFLPLYILAIPFMFIHNYILATYIGLIILFGIIMLISYFVGLIYWHNNRKSLIFALFYGLSNYLFNFAIGTFDIGQFFAAAFIPLVVFGCYSILFLNNNNHWLLLPIGLSAVTYTHLISTIMIFSLVIFMFILSIVLHKISALKLYRLVLSAAVYFLMTIFYWYNLIIVLRSNIRATQSPKFILGENAYNILESILKNEQSIGSIFLAFSIVGLLLWANLDNITHGAFFIALFYTFIISSASNIFWVILSKTPIVKIQWAGRFIWIINFFICFFVAETIFELVNKKVSLRFRKIIFYLLMITPLILFWSESVTLINHGSSQTAISRPATYSNPLPFQNFKINSQNGFRYIISSDYTGVGSLDYLPSKSMSNFKSLTDSQLFMNGKKINYYGYSRHNGMMYLIKKHKVNSIYDLPFANYSDCNYKVTVNGKRVPYYSTNRGTVGFRLSANNNNNNDLKIDVFYIPKRLQRFFGYLSFISSAFVLCCYIKKYRYAR